MNRVARLLACALVVVALAIGPASPAYAFLGVLARLAELAEIARVATVGAKGAAVVAGAEALNASGKAAKIGTVAEEAGTAANAAQISKASGLGPAVPAEVAALLKTPGKTLADVPDIGARAWLSIPASRMKPSDAELMASDYVRLLEGKPTLGPRAGTTGAGNAAKPAALPTHHMRTIIPWHAVELLMHAARLGSKGAQAEIDRLCAYTGPGKPHASCALLERPVVWSFMSDPRMLTQPNNGRSPQETPNRKTPNR